MKNLLAILFAAILSYNALSVSESAPEFVSFKLNEQNFTLTEGMTPRPLEPSDDDPQLLIDNAYESSSVFLMDQNWVEIIRQDERWQPHTGLALAFSFDAATDTFPYRPEKAAIQFKDFTFGGQHFSKQDTANFSGIYNDYSSEVKLELLDYQNDTLIGKFSGVLISGSGKMAYLEDGSFKVRLYQR